MFLEVMKTIDRVLARAPDFIREYKRRYPFQYYSLDANQSCSTELLDEFCFLGLVPEVGLEPT